jgi:hypothetical protein
MRPADTTRTSASGIRHSHGSKSTSPCQHIGRSQASQTNGSGDPDENCLSTNGLNSLRILPGGKNTNGTFPSNPTLTRSRLRLLIFDSTNSDLPDFFLKRVLAIDRDAQVRRQWDSVMNPLIANSGIAPEIITDVFSDSASVIRRMNEIWDLRVRSNYAAWPVYFAVSRIGQPPLVRFEIERLGGHFLYLADVPSHFTRELEQIRLNLSTLRRSLPYWQITREGQGATSRAAIHLLCQRRLTRLCGSDRHVAVFAAMLKRNALPRSIGDLLKILAEDSLFKQSGGSFDVPSRNTLKMYIHRDFPKYLQRVFNSARSGYSAHRVLERVRLNAKTMGYKIRGQFLPVDYY